MDLAADSLSGGPGVLIILGAPVDADGRPGVALRRRIDCALQVLRRRPDLSVVASGGVAPFGKSDRAEAEVIAEALQCSGIAVTRILLETRSRNTWENAAGVADLLRRERLCHPDEARAPSRLWLVTDPWHAPRARLAFRAHGLSLRPLGCAEAWRQLTPRWLPVLLHEVIGYAFYLLRWLFLRWA